MSIGDKIKQFRIKKSLSLQQLADLAGLAKPTIQQYEEGTIRPSNRALIAVADALNVDVWSLLHISESELELAEFRHGEKLLDSEIEKKKIHDLVIDYSTIYLELEHILGTEIEFENPLDDLLIQSYADVEKAAFRVRKKWKLANNPIDDVCALLEGKGFKIISFERETESPGLCGFMKNGTKRIPFIILNTKHEHTRETTRKRFTILHECAHLILKFCETVTKEFEEKLCNRFASAFLVPGEALIEYLGRNRTNISLDELKSLKEIYGASVRSIIFRANDVGLIDDAICKKWNLLYEQWYAEGKVFGTYTKSKEIPQRFDRLVTRGYMEKRISKEKVVEMLDLKMEDVDRRFGNDRFSLI
ncbi:helix-turn-helix domain-containing protein [Pedobacter cryophilus]|uniref:Helix-turn-helix domain-containing protein n=1 Tax=Pedobacter cryophilus TaxID=2571271 RepID=A0A4U1C0P2_9SPHI|nr:XRE family transcriptional regulator [Pedobacter cryophilus]TKB99148.1 helix-turn-helix domain-containing protein [Pedobacter cryophilus]